MSKEWNGVERRQRWGAGLSDKNGDCHVDPECFYRTKQQVEINTKRIESIDLANNKRIEIIEKAIRDFLDAKLVAEGAVKGGKATLWVASAILLTSMVIVISLFIAVLSGKLSLVEFFKIVF